MMLKKTETEMGNAAPEISVHVAEQGERKARSLQDERTAAITRLALGLPDAAWKQLQVAKWLLRNRWKSWAELERRLSDGRPRNQPEAANGGDSPAWSRRRQPYQPPSSLAPPFGPRVRNCATTGRSW